MSNLKGGTVSKVFEIVEPYAKELGLDIWDIRYLKEGASYFLRIFIDKPEGITIDDCENLSRAIDEPLDEADPIKEAYFLEVSSPGLGRELLKPEHFERYIGEKIKAKLYKSIDGQKELGGILVDYEKGNVIIECNSKRTVLEKGDYSKINLDDFDF
ncbi:MAG: ribosome maturation factor RimP [Clostridia bacterium]|nr:ribosome maturation factor RimP [Clostridia bacterium]